MGTGWNYHPVLASQRWLNILTGNPYIWQKPWYPAISLVIHWYINWSVVLFCRDFGKCPCGKVDDTYPLSKSIDHHMKRPMTRRASWFIELRNLQNTNLSWVEKHSNWLDKLDKWGHLRKDDWDNLLQKKRLLLTFNSARPGIWRIVFCEVRGWHKGHVCYATAEGQMTEDTIEWWDWWIDHCNMNHISGYSWLEIPIPSMKFPWQHEWILVSPSFSARMEEVIFTRQ